MLPTFKASVSSFYFFIVTLLSANEFSSCKFLKAAAAENNAAAAAATCRQTEQGAGQATTVVRGHSMPGQALCRWQTSKLIEN